MAACRASRRLASSSGSNASPVPALAPGDVFKYTGRGEYDFIFDLEKFGGMPMGKLLVRFEHWYGEYGNVSLNTGSFPPAVFPAAIPPAPNNPGVPYMTRTVPGTSSAGRARLRPWACM